LKRKKYKTHIFYSEKYIQAAQENRLNQMFELEDNTAESTLHSRVTGFFQLLILIW